MSEKCKWLEYTVEENDTLKTSPLFSIFASNFQKLVSEDSSLKYYELFLQTISNFPELLSSNLFTTKYPKFSEDVRQYLVQWIKSKHLLPRINYFLLTESKKNWYFLNPQSHIVWWSPLIKILESTRETTIFFWKSFSSNIYFGKDESLSSAWLTVHGKIIINLSKWCSLSKHGQDGLIYNELMHAFLDSKHNFPDHNIYKQVNWSSSWISFLEELAWNERVDTVWEVLSDYWSFTKVPWFLQIRLIDLFWTIPVKINKSTWLFSTNFSKNITQYLWTKKFYFSIYVFLLEWGIMVKSVWLKWLTFSI